MAFPASDWTNLWRRSDAPFPTVAHWALMDLLQGFGLWINDSNYPCGSQPEHVGGIMAFCISRD